MSQAIMYIDGIGRITVTNNLAHIDFVAVIPPASESGQPNAQISQRVVMGLPQFVRMCSEMAGHLNRMEAQGLIKRSEAGQS